jgi:hypothetical protein
MPKAMASLKMAWDGQQGGVRTLARNHGGWDSECPGHSHPQGA